MLTLDPSEILARLRRGALAIAVCGIAVLALAIVVLASLAPAYTARVQILIDPTDLRVVDNDVTPRSGMADSGVSIAESQVRVIGSDNVLRRVVTKLNLQNDPEFAKPLADPDSFTERLKEVLGLAPPRSLNRDPILRAMEELGKNVTVRRAERTFVVDVLVRSRGVEKSALIANTIADAYLSEETSARTSAAARASDALSSRLNDLRSALQGAENRLAKFREEHNLVATNGRLLSDQQLGELSQQLTAASIRTGEVRARADQARQLRVVNGSTALPEMLNSTEMRALRQQYSDMSRAVAEMGTRLGPRHPMVAEQNAQLRDLERTLAREKTRIIDSTTRELDRAVAAENTIKAELDRLKRQTTVNDRALIGQREFERDVDSQRALYEAYLKRARETGQQERLDTTNIRVISAASPPLSRSWPPSPKIVLPAALIFGLLLGAALAIWLGGRRRQPESIPASVLVSLSEAPRRA